MKPMSLADHAEAWAQLLGYLIPPRDSWEWEILYNAWVSWAFSNMRQPSYTG